MTKEQLISALREAKVGDFELVDKELKFGCEVKNNEADSHCAHGNSHVFLHCEHVWCDEILGTPPSMQRLFMFHIEKNGIVGSKPSNLLWLWHDIDPDGKMDFFELIHAANEDQFKEIKHFCESFIL